MRAPKWGVSDLLSCILQQRLLEMNWRPFLVQDLYSTDRRRIPRSPTTSVCVYALFLYEVAHGKTRAHDANLRHCVSFLANEERFCAATVNVRVRHGLCKRISG